MNAPHEVTNACADRHCFAHNVDEGATGWHVCGECMHVYPSARALRRDYRREVLRTPRFGVPLWRLWWRALTIRTSQIHFCQHCVHDW
jgi:hypothetical protein